MNLSAQQIHELCNIAKNAAREAGVYIQTRFNEPYEKRHKTGGDSLASQIVTDVDLKAQQTILEYLQGSIEKYDLGLLTEEANDDHSRLRKDYFWCIDPIDGTLPFTEHRTGYAVSIALVSRSGDPVIGVAYIPDLEDCYIAITGEGVTLNGSALIPAKTDSSHLHLYMDRSFREEPYYGSVIEELQRYAKRNMRLEAFEHTALGGVRNALSVLRAVNACYFKFPKPSQGGGSIWDYAATRLFFEELARPVSNASGKRLNLNDPETTFMNRQGVVFATHRDIQNFLLELATKIS